MLQLCLKLAKVLEISNFFLMSDLEAEVKGLFIRAINNDNIKELCGTADKLGCKELIRACAKFMVKNGIVLDGEEVRQMPDIVAAFMEASKRELERLRNRVKPPYFGED